MLPNQFSTFLASPFNKKIIVASAFLILLMPCLANAATQTDAATMMVNFAKTVPNLMRMVTALAYVMGMYLVFQGILGLKQYGEQRTMMSSSHELKGPIIMIFVGAALIYLPSTVVASFNTFWTDGSPLAYIPKSKDQFSIVYQNGYLIVQLIGTIAFIRGLMTLTQLGGHHNSQPGTFGKAIAYIVSGIFCINLNGFLTVIGNTLGVQL
jgi:intracellular multiplication protein IcmC